MSAPPPPSDGPVAADPVRAAAPQPAAGSAPDEERAEAPDPVLRAAISRHPAARRPDVIRLPD